MNLRFNVLHAKLTFLFVQGEASLVLVVVPLLLQLESAVLLMMQPKLRDVSE